MTTEQRAAAGEVRSYIQHNATKSLEEITDLVQKGHDQVFALIDGLSESQATFKPSADDWSVLETMRHVVAAKRGVARLCARLASGEPPPDVGGEGQLNAQNGMVGQEYATLAEARAAALAEHEALLAFVASVTPDSNVEARFPHFIFSELNCREWAVFQRVHDGDHARQIEKVIAAPGFPES